MGHKPIKSNPGRLWDSSCLGFLSLTTCCSVLQNDLGTFKGEISQDLMARTLQRGVGTHYQVIGHKLYREHNCMFPAR